MMILPTKKLLLSTICRKARDYEEAYKAGKRVEEAVKAYKSHRRVFNENINFNKFLPIFGY